MLFMWVNIKVLDPVVAFTILELLTEEATVRPFPVMVGKGPWENQVRVLLPSEVSV